MKAMKLFMVSITLTLIFSLITVMGGGYTILDFEESLNVLSNNTGDRGDPNSLISRMEAMGEQDNIMATATAGLEFSIAALVNTASFIVIFVLFLLNSFAIGIPSILTGQTFIERVFGVTITIFVLFNNINVVKAFFEMIIKSGSDR